MTRILAIDYGTKKVGLAVTDPLQIIVNGLATVATAELEDYVSTYTAAEPVSKIVLGYPRHPDGQPAQLAPQIEVVAQRLGQLLPQVQVVLHDESYTTKQAKRIIQRSGLKRKKRRDKKLVDKISAVLILQDYLQHY